ncbi:MAG TPA: alpha/beta fold hydrolase [Verrucomicrobiae bacterium]|jgi:dipeptidyl aminopeptidase/acylaminoacyl peptidase|nr:alpha/beta fold hydrolase [Verrucomicrobiae bacterium]
MLNFLQPNHPWAFHILRLAAEAGQGGGDIFDIARLAARLEPDDRPGWERGWLELAEKIEAEAKRALAAGHPQSAIAHFFSANQYYRMSDVFLTAAEMERKRQRFLKAQENFRAAAGLSLPPIEVIRVRSGGEEYDGYLCHPDHPKPGKWPAILFLGGADAYAEEIYFGARPMLARGWAVLLADTPGRGSSHYVKNIPTRPDYEVPAKACIDYLAARPEVDPDRIAVMGISMAGYYAPRAAAFEQRVKALVCWSGCYSILDDLYLFCPALQPTLRRILGGVDDAEARERLKHFTMQGAAEKIKCPTLITHGGADRLMRVEGARRLFAELGSADKTLKIYDDPRAGGTIHCSHDDWAHNIPYMLDWLEERL